MDRIAAFARWPAVGRVKTRLSPALPATLACDLYRAMLQDALGAVAAVESVERWVYWDGDPPKGERPPVPGGIATAVQTGGDLGRRLSAAFDQLLGAAGDRAVVIGADAPDLVAATLRLALARLDAHDLVLGPALDGGYTLIGLGRRAPRLFSGIDWGSGRVLEQTLAAARRDGLTVALLGPLEDVDTPDALIRLVVRRLADGVAGAAHTDAALRTLGLLPAERAG